MPRRRRLALGLLALFSASPITAQRGPDPRGAYEFESISTRGDPFNGTVHLYGDPGRVQGFIYTTIDPPIPVDGARWLGPDTLGVRFHLGPTIVTQVFAFNGDRFSGHYSFTRDGQESVIPLSGIRQPRTPHHDLPPTPCEVRGVQGAVRCAMLHVPEDPAAPSGRYIPLRIVILPAFEESEPDAMFPLAGGPGQAATEIAGGYAGTMAGIRRHRDIVIVDQRGTGASNPLRCDFGDPNERAQLVLTWRLPSQGLGGCRAGLSEHADLRFYHSWIAAGDLDRVREWLGYSAVNLYGGSYGTRLAQAYLARYPDRTRTVTLRAVVPPDAALSLGSAPNALASADMVYEECRLDAECRATFPRGSEELGEVVAKLNSAPATVRVRDPITGDSTEITVDRDVFSGALRRILMDGSLVRDVPFVVHRAALGDYSPLIPGIEATLGVSRSLYIGMSFSVGCPEDAPLIANADIRRVTAGTFMGDGPARRLLMVCDQWASGDVPDAFHRLVTVDVPVLVLSGRYDPATPAAWGRRVAEALPQALHVEMPGVSHSPFPECAQDLMTALVESGGIAELDTSCVTLLRAQPFRLRE